MHKVYLVYGFKRFFNQAVLSVLEKQLFQPRAKGT